MALFWRLEGREKEDVGGLGIYGKMVRNFTFFKRVFF